MLDKHECDAKAGHLFAPPEFAHLHKSNYIMKYSILIHQILPEFNDRVVILITSIFCIYAGFLLWLRRG